MSKVKKEDLVIIPISFEKSQKELLEDVASSERVSQASIVRKALKQYFSSINPETTETK